MFQRLSRAAALGAATMLLVAACGGSGSPSPSPSSAPATEAPTTSATPTPAPSATVAPSGSAGASGSFAIPSIPGANGAPDLAARLPDQLSGVTLSKLSFAGANVLAGASVDPQLQGILGVLGKNSSDLSVAIAFDPSGQSEASMVAVRVAGVSGSQMMSLVRTATQSDSQNATFSQVQLGGKDVTKVVEDDETQWIWVDGDTAFIVEGVDQAAATTAFAAVH